MGGGKATRPETATGANAGAAFEGTMLRSGEAFALT
jgi:hypothetical protein